jgi:hypothetical protein
VQKSLLHQIFQDSSFSEWLAQAPLELVIAFAYRQSDPRCDTTRDAVANFNMINLCARIIVG